MDLIVVCGPTASGKTDLAIKLAKENNGEIVNADSMQIYKYMDIGTAKPTKEEQAGIPHYLMDFVHPNESFSVAKYCELAHNTIKDITDRGKTPVMVGGTGLYIDSVVNNITFSDIPSDKEYCDLLYNEAKINGNEYIYKKLQTIDSVAAEKISVNDTKRIVRALEIYHTTGKNITWHNEKSRSNPSPYNATYYAISHDRDKLYDRINRRVDIMLEKGLIDEVKYILSLGVSKDCTSMQAIGYKEIVMYLNGEVSLEKAVDMIKQGSRRYAKRQLTWFRANKNIKWLDWSDLF